MEIKQVSVHSIQVCQGINALNTFVLRVEHFYIVGEIPGYRWAHLPCWVPIAPKNQSQVHVYAL